MIGQFDELVLYNRCLLEPRTEATVYPSHVNSDGHLLFDRYRPTLAYLGGNICPLYAQLSNTEISMTKG